MYLTASFATRTRAFLHGEADWWDPGPTGQRDREEGDAVGRNLADGEVGSGRRDHQHTRRGLTSQTEGLAGSWGHRSAPATMGGGGGRRS